MKEIRYLYLCLVLGTIGFLLVSSSGGRDDESSGAPPGNTCAQCHSNGGGGGSLEIAGVPSIYTPSTMYRITITSVDPNALVGGFQMVARNASNVNIGTFNGLTGVRFSSNGGVTQNAPKSFNGGMVRWMVDWISPASGAAVTFYAASVCANGNGNSGNGDDVYTTTLEVSGDGSGCIPPSPSIETNGTICVGQSATLIATGGSTYKWSNGSTASTIQVSPIVSSTYTVTVTDNLNCTSSTSVIQYVSQGPGIQMFSTNPACNGVNNGSVTANESGIPPLTFQWSNGINFTSNTINNLPSGIYTVTITDGAGCRSSSSRTLVSGSSISLSTSVTNTGCNGNLGSVLANVNGGATPYFYQIGNASNNTGEFQGLSAGSYIISVSDAQGCRSTKSFVVQNGTNFSASLQFNPLTCLGGTTNIQVITNGGVAPFTYDIGQGAQTGSTFLGVSAGTYVVTVTASDGCTRIASSTIPNGQPFSINIVGPSTICPGSSNTLNAPVGLNNYHWNNGENMASILITNGGIYSVTATNSSGCKGIGSANITMVTGSNISIANNLTFPCNGPSTTLVVNSPSGFTPMIYQWSTGSNTSNIVAINSGAYTVTVSNLQGCTKIASTTISFSPTLNTNGTITQPICGGTTGDITVSPNSPNYSYIWSDGGSLSPIRSGLLPGNYTVTVTVMGGTCRGSTTFNIIDPSVPQVVFTVSPSTCGRSNGQIVGSITQGVFYNWNDGGVGNIRSNLGVGLYQATITNISTGCIIIKSVIVQSNSNPIGFNTSVTCQAGPGTGVLVLLPFQTNNGNLTYSINGSSFSPVSTYSNLVNGLYQILAKDILTGCESTNTVSINCGCVNSTISGPQLVCEGIPGEYKAIGNPPFVWGLDTSIAGQIDSTGKFLPSEGYRGNLNILVRDPNGCIFSKLISVGGTNVSYSVSNTSCGLNNGCILPDVLDANNYGFNYSSNGAQSSVLCPLSSGIYSVTATNQFNGCFSIATIPISTSLPITLEMRTKNPNCHDGGSISLVSSNDLSIAWGDVASNSSLRTNLSEGRYFVTVTNAIGCTVFSNTNLVRTDSINVTLASNGTSITATASPVEFIYNYSWNNGSINRIISNLQAGRYCVTVTSAEQCTTQSCLQITGVGSIDKILGNSIKIYPNPSSGIFLIEGDPSLLMNCKMRVYDQIGRIIISDMVNPNILGNQIVLDINNLSDGLYILGIQFEDSNLFKQIMVRK